MTRKRGNDGRPSLWRWVPDVRGPLRFPFLNIFFLRGFLVIIIIFFAG
jgi:hypothetical protein